MEHVAELHPALNDDLYRPLESQGTTECTQVLLVPKAPPPHFLQIFTIFFDSEAFGGAVRMSAYADARDWDPKGSSSLSSVNAYSQLYNQIVQMDTVDTSLVVCDLCSSWDVTNGGQTFTFHIRDGIKWQDGQKGLQLRCRSR